MYYVSNCKKGVEKVFKYDTMTLVKYPNGIEKKVFGSPKRTYRCPVCGDVKRKVVMGFEKQDDRKEIYKYYEMPRPVCDDCFELEVYNDLMNRFYETNIY